MIKTKNKKSNFKNISSRVALFVVLGVLIAWIGISFKQPIEEFINKDNANSVYYSEYSESDLEIHFINVGAADCIFIELPDGKNMLIDSGRSGDEPVDYIQEFVFDGQTENIDYMIITHPDADHVGGADEILEIFEVGTIYRPAVYSSEVAGDEAYVATEIGIANPNVKESDAYADFVTASNAEIVANIIVMGDEIVGEVISNVEYGYSITFLAPMQDYFSDQNNYSAVLLLEYAGKEALFTGDIDAGIEQDLIDAYNLEGVDILKVAHHGSNYASSETFLTEVSAQYAIISTDGEVYGHPAEETLNRLEYSGILSQNILRTDINGDIVVGISDDGKVKIAANNFISELKYQIEDVIIVLIITLFAVTILRVKNNN